MEKKTIAQVVHEAIGKGEAADKLVDLLAEIAGAKPEKEAKAKKD